MAGPSGLPRRPHQWGTQQPAAAQHRLRRHSTVCSRRHSGPRQRRRVSSSDLRTGALRNPREHIDMPHRSRRTMLREKSELTNIRAPSYDPGVHLFLTLKNLQSTLADAVSRTDQNDSLPSMTFHGQNTVELRHQLITTDHTAGQ